MSQRLEQLILTLVHQGELHWMDSDGRPLGEQSSPQRYAQAGAEERPCPYADSRRGLPINISALRQLRQHWDDILATIAHLGGKIVPEDQAVTLHHAWATNAAANRMAVFVRLGQGLATVPAPVSALYKVSLGFTKVLPELLLQDPAAAEQPLHERLPPAAFFTHLDDQKLLIGSAQACAGSRAQVLRYYQALMSPDRYAARPPIGGRPPQLDDFARLARELFALIAVWVATVGGFVWQGRLQEVPDYHSAGPQHRSGWPIGLKVYRCPRIPSVGLVRGQRRLDPVQVTWMYPDGQYPRTLIRFLERVDIEHERPISAADQLFLQEARDVVARMLDALGWPSEAGQLTLQMFAPPGR